MSSARASGPHSPGAFHLSDDDAVRWLSRIDSETVDLVITDPPYESLEKHRAIGTTTRLKHSKASSNNWFEIFPNSRFSELFREVHRVLKKDRHFYLFCDQETAFVAKPLGEACGFKFWKPLVWDKRAMGMGYHYRARYEFILFFEKGKRKLNDLGVADVIEAPRIHHGYPTEKPVAVSEVLVSQSTQPGELVIDPFCGSGSVGVASVILGCKFAGSDTCAEAVDVSRRRLIEAGAQEVDFFKDEKIVGEESLGRRARRSGPRQVEGTVQATSQLLLDAGQADVKSAAQLSLQPTAGVPPRRG